MKRRHFFRLSAAGLPFIAGCRWDAGNSDTPGYSPLFHIKQIPDPPFREGSDQQHGGVDQLLQLMGEEGLKFFNSSAAGTESGPGGMIGADDIVILKVNAQWKYRGATNSDVVRGLIQRILNHPDGFSGEVIILENGQGRGSLNCDTFPAYGDRSVRANAYDEGHSFTYLSDVVFRNDPVHCVLLDPIRNVWLDESDHETNGYRRLENVSYPCFTTPLGNRVELREGLWNGWEHEDRLRLINIPVLKHHDRGGSEITAAVKHMYGLLSMKDGFRKFRHYEGLGETCGRMFSRVKTPVLNIIDAIWVSHRALKGFPPETTMHVGQLLAGQDPVALDYWAAKHILYPIDRNERHHPDHPIIKKWISAAAGVINADGGLYFSRYQTVGRWATFNESDMEIFSAAALG